MSASTPENGTSTAATTPRISMLPSGTRLASGAPPQLAERGAASRADIAPSTAAIASVGVTAPGERQGGDDENDGERGMRRPGDAGGKDRGQHRLAAERGKHEAEGLGLGQRHHGEPQGLQRKGEQAETDQRPADALGPVGLHRQEHEDAAVTKTGQR